MEQVIAKLQHEMRTNHTNQPDVASKRAMKWAYVRNFHEDHWHPSGPALDNMAQQLTRWTIAHL
jgi:hypothetical protein